MIIWASDGGEMAKNIKHDWRNMTACISYKLKIFHLTVVNDFQVLKQLIESDNFDSHDDKNR